MSTARSPVSSRTAVSQPSLRTAWCAPHRKANSRFCSSLTTAIVRSPMARPSWIAAVPTPPAAPCTSRVSPARAWARLTSAKSAVRWFSGTAAPASKLIPSGKGSTRAAGTDTTSCQQP